tara:strand:- start:163 stop:615 length:453 start_codon:yes stop_codon:yes gene_type:complete
MERFRVDFSKEIEPDESVKQAQDTKDPYEEIQTDVSEDTMKKVYRKVANKVHPDKKGGDKEKFQIASKANKNKDFGALLEMADELEIDIELSNELINEMTKQCTAVIQNITSMKTTTAWTWAHSKPQERESLKLYILETLKPPTELNDEQ